MLEQFENIYMHDKVINLLRFMNFGESSSRVDILAMCSPWEEPKNILTFWVIHLVRLQNFLKNYDFLLPITHKYVCVSCVSGGMEC